MSVSVRELYEDEEARESDHDSAIESAAGSELSDGGRGGDKEEGLRIFLPQQKLVLTNKHANTPVHADSAHNAFNSRLMLVPFSGGSCSYWTVQHCWRSLK